MEAEVRPLFSSSEMSYAQESQQPHSSPSQDTIVRAISTYPFHSDPEYQAGLAAILGHPETLASDTEIAEKEDLVLQAKCFYFARKHNLQPIDPAVYKALLDSSTTTSSDLPPPPSSATSTLSPTAEPFTPSSPSSSQSQITSSPLAASNPNQIPGPEPPYPTSFAAIVDLITRNIPIPGIEEIPTTVLEPGSSKVDRTPRRRKPWETDADAGAETRTGTGTATGVDQQKQAEAEDGEGKKDGKTGKEGEDKINGHRATGVGVVNILKPNAVPDSGLLARD